MELTPLSFLVSPITFALLVTGTVVAVWMALAPARPVRSVGTRLDGYLDRSDLVEAADMERSFGNRVISPMFRRLLRVLGALLPQNNIQVVNDMLSKAGSPGGLTALDYVGLRLLVGVVAGVVYYLIFGRELPFFEALRNAFLALFGGYMLPKFWIRSKISSRRHQIARALPDALDMLTIGVEAGLAFESAMLRVGDQWNNALSQEFRRVVSEMRLGVQRNEALRRMADRNGVEDLNTFVAVLIQSNMLGVSIAQVLHGQAEQMRVKRRQMAEQQARQATVKIVVVLVFFIFPALFIVILGPAVPRIMGLLRAMSTG